MATERHAGTLPPDFILPDPPRTVDMMRGLLTRRMFSVLDIRFGRRKDVLVAGFGYLRRDPMDESERFAPNIIVAFGVDPKAIIARNGYIISEVGKPPDFIMEVATRFSATPDLSDKREGYRRCGVGEYWRFDETGGARNGVPLAGDALANGGAYIPIPIIRDEHFRHWGYSDALNLYIGWDDGLPRFFDPIKREFLPDIVELSRHLELAEVRRGIAAMERDAADGESGGASTELSRLRRKSSKMMLDELRIATGAGGER